MVKVLKNTGIHFNLIRIGKKWEHLDLSLQLMWALLWVHAFVVPSLVCLAENAYKRLIQISVEWVFRSNERTDNRILKKLHTWFQIDDELALFNEPKKDKKRNIILVATVFLIMTGMLILDAIAKWGTSKSLKESQLQCNAKTVSEF